MSNETNWQQVKEIFGTAIEVEPAQRLSFVTAQCGDDATLREEVLSWLSSYAESEDFIERPAFSHSVLTEGNAAGRQFGSYRIIREIGHGGMGAVYLAERTDGEFDQQVALKIVRQSIAESHVVERFRQERQILASLSHPNIARLLDGGVSDIGEPFLVMEYVDGEPITTFADKHSLRPEERVDLFLKVCAAVSFAHDRLVIHRDIKPGNILVTPDGEPKLLDFGLARLVSDNIDDASSTQTAFRAFTPAYASPEHLRGEPVSTATDVYSLGVVLYELLTGGRPYQHEGRSLDEVLRTLETTEPAPVDGPTGARVPVDLANIILTALRREPERRYSSVDRLANDIRRFQTGLPVSARPNTVGYRSGKFISRHRVGVFAAAAIALTLIAGSVVSVWQARVAARERDHSEQERVKAEQLNAFLQTILSAASPEEKGKDAKVIEVIDDASRRVRTEFADQPELVAQALLTIGTTYNDLGILDKAERDLRGSVEIYSDILGRENKATALAMIRLGDVLTNESKHDQAGLILQDAVEIERRLSAGGSKELALGLFDLGELHIRKREFDLALPLLNESISMYDRISGEVNPDSAYALVSLGRAQERLNDLTTAEDTYRRSIAMYRGLPSRYEGRMAAAMLNLGNLLITTRQYDDAIAMMKEGTSIYEKQGEGFNVFIARTYLCKAYFARGEYSKVIELASPALQTGRSLDLGDTLDQALTETNLGLSLSRTGRPREGEPHIRQALDIVKALSPTRDLNWAVIEGALGETLLAQDKYREAAPLLETSFDAIRTNRGNQDPLTVMATDRLTQLHRYQPSHKPQRQ